MRPRTSIIVAAGLALLLGLGYLADWRVPTDVFWPRPPKYALVPGPVTGSRAAGITSDFTLVKERLINPGEQGQQPFAYPRGIETNHEGGACLVFAADDLGLTSPETPNCSGDKSCELAGSEFGYCAMKDDKRCWVKPASIAAGLCRKSKVEGVKWEEAVKNPLPKTGSVNLGPAQLPANRPVRVRLITCLEKGVATSETGCRKRGADMVEQWGRVKEL